MCDTYELSMEILTYELQKENSLYQDKTLLRHLIPIYALCMRYSVRHIALKGNLMNTLGTKGKEYG